jgi:hypothetical protein
VRRRENMAGMSAGAVERGEREKGRAREEGEARLERVAKLDERIVQALRVLYTQARTPGGKAVVMELHRDYAARMGGPVKAKAVLGILGRLAGAQAVARNMRKLGGLGFGGKEMLDRLERYLDEAVGECVK